MGTSLHDTHASILAIGTELTTGQVTNRNAAWLSEQLVNLGYTVTEHLTVADDKDSILDALSRCSNSGNTVMVTGGLGPTSDDFTRDVITQWLDRTLVFDDASWTHIEERLTRFGVPVAPSNRQQCYFPEGARIIPNPQGTANAFIVNRDNAWIYVLPGPPREVEAVWHSGIAESLRSRLPSGQALELHTWQCLGKSEAEVGELTERALQGSGLQIGYRAHRPFVEVKLWIPSSRSADRKHWCDRVEAALGPWIATRGGEDLAKTFLKGLAGQPEIELWDLSSAGILAERLGGVLRRISMLERPEVRILTELKPMDAPPESEVRTLLTSSECDGPSFALAGPDSSGKWALGMRSERGEIRIETEASPWKVSPESIDRVQRYVVERALLVWSRWSPSDS